MATQTIVIQVRERKSELPKKTASIIFFLFSFYVIPLTLKPELLLTWQVILVATICTVLFATPPRISIEESKKRKTTDKNTIWIILAVSGFGQIISLVEWAYFSSGNSSIWIITGAILLIAGTLFRIYAIHLLGKYFSSTVQIKSEHKIVTVGAYRYLRHPSYTGAYVAMLGCSVFLHSIIGMLIFGIGMLFVYHLRIKTEEQIMNQKFKDEYLNYSKRTWRIFPFVW